MVICWVKEVRRWYLRHRGMCNILLQKKPPLLDPGMEFYILLRECWWLPWRKYYLAWRFIGVSFPKIQDQSTWKSRWCIVACLSQRWKSCCLTHSFPCSLFIFFFRYTYPKVNILATKWAQVLKNNISANGCSKLILGDSQFDGFMKCFYKHICYHPDELKQVGVNALHLGLQTWQWFLQLCHMSQQGELLLYQLYLSVCNVEYGWSEQALFDFWKGWLSVSWTSDYWYGLQKSYFCLYTAIFDFTGFTEKN